MPGKDAYRMSIDWRRQELFMKRIEYTIENSSHVLPWLSCQDLAMILS